MIVCRGGAAGVPVLYLAGEGRGPVRGGRQRTGPPHSDHSSRKLLKTFIAMQTSNWATHS